MTSLLLGNFNRNWTKNVPRSWRKALKYLLDHHPLDLFVVQPHTMVASVTAHRELLLLPTLKNSLSQAPWKQWQHVRLSSQTIWELYIQHMSTSTAATHRWFACRNTPQRQSSAFSQSQSHTCTCGLAGESLCRPRSGWSTRCYRTSTIWWTSRPVFLHGDSEKARWITMQNGRPIARQ